MDEPAAVGEWTERPLMATKEALGLPEEAPDPVTVWECRTEDGQLQRAALFGEGQERNPWVLRVTTRRTPREELEAGQSLGEARFPTVLEIQGMANLLQEGTVVQLPHMVAGADVPHVQQFTIFQLQQVGAVKGTPAGRTWGSALVVTPSTSKPGRA